MKTIFMKNKYQACGAGVRRGGKGERRARKAGRLQPPTQAYKYHDIYPRYSNRPLSLFYMGKLNVIKHYHVQPQS